MPSLQTSVTTVTPRGQRSVAALETATHEKSTYWAAPYFPRAVSDSVAVDAELCHFLVEIGQVLAEIARTEDTASFIQICILLLEALVELCASSGIPVAVKMRTPIMVAADKDFVCMRQRPLPGSKISFARTITSQPRELT